MKLPAAIAAFVFSAAFAFADDFRAVGSYVLQSHVKISDGTVRAIPIKPLPFRVFSDGVKIRVEAGNDSESHTTFDIYRSDGIGRQRPGRGALEVIPGVQALSRADGIVRHLRLTKESLTLTTFPGVSDQTIVSHAIAAEPANPAPVSPPPEGAHAKQ